MSDLLEYAQELPEASMLREQLSSAIDHWRERNSLITKVRDYLTGKNPISAPRSAQYKIQTMHTFHLLAAINEKSARFLDRPRYAVVATDVSQAARNRASDQEHWLNEATAALDRNSNTSVWSAVTRDALSFDVGVERIERAPAAFWPELVISPEDGKSKLMRIYEDADEFEKAKDEYLKRAGLPMRSVYVSPDSYLPIHEGPTPVQEFQVEYRALRDVMRNPMFDTSSLEGYPKGRDGGLSTQVTILHLVNQKFHAYYVLAPHRGYQSNTNSWPRAETPSQMSIGQPILLYAYEHGLPCSPYNVVAGRFGGFRSGQDWVEGAMLEAICQLNQDADELLSQAATYHRNMAWPTPVTKYDPELRGADDTGPPKPVQIQEGQSIALWKTESIEKLFDPSPNPAFESLYDKISNRLEQLAGSTVLFGQRSAGVDTGYHHQLQISQAEHLDAKIEENLASGAVNRARIMLEHVKALGEKVYVSPIEKGPSGRSFGKPIALHRRDLDPMPILSAKVRGTSPLNVAANIRAVLDATMVRPGHNEPLMPDVVAMERYLGVEDAEDIIALRDIQRERNNLTQSGFLTGKIAQKLNMMLVEEGVPTVSPEQAANADPALHQALNEINESGATEGMGGVNPSLLDSLAQGQDMAGVRQPSPFNGRGGGLPAGLPQPEQQVGLAINRTPVTGGFNGAV